MAGKGHHEDILSLYSFEREKPTQVNGNYSVWTGTQIATNLPVTIRILKHPHAQLQKYLKKLKDIRSEYAIKLHQVTADSTSLLVISEQATYGNLKGALHLCKHLDQTDSVFLARLLLNGHVDLLRADCNWFGTEQDIEFTDSGPKLSWNNGCQFNLANPFPAILGKLAAREAGSSLLPFPEIKAMNELIGLSRENASQIALHPQMKQKIKLSRRKGSSWVGIREVKNKNQYFDELAYLAVSREHGFIRVKIYEAGKISPNLMSLNLTKSTFTKVLGYSDQNDRTIILSEYANDGNLQSYVKRLKTAGVVLKEEQIQFFFYSLFDPIKMVQESTLKSINMLHIKNIYIENGIPKIGEPIPLNEKLASILADRSDVPDFYHPDFKKNYTLHNPHFDTYSIGVLLYKLMYTEYPIFPNSRVHIPTTPNYNKRLKISLQIFLNEGGSLSDLQKKIEISENVLKQIQENKEILRLGGKKKVEHKQVAQDISENQDFQETVSKISVQNEEEEVEDEDEESWSHIIWAKLQLAPPVKVEQQSLWVSHLENSPYRRCRIWTKIVLVTFLYLFGFYYGFIYNEVMLLANQNLLQTITVTVSNGSSYQIITSDYYNFTTTFANQPQTLVGLQNMNCLLNSYQGGPDYAATIKNTSSWWLGYLFVSLAVFSTFTLILVIIIAYKAVQISILDYVRAAYYRQNAYGHFNLSNFFLLSFGWQSLLASHFYFSNYVFFQQSQPCVGYAGGAVYGSTTALFTGSFSLISTYGAVMVAQLVLMIGYLVVAGLNDKMSYNKVLNPLVLMIAAITIFTFIFRFGVILGSSYFPSVANDPTGILKAYFSNGSFVGILGVFPELFLIVELAVSLLIDWLFFGVVDRSHKVLLDEDSMAKVEIEDDDQ